MKKLGKILSLVLVGVIAATSLSVSFTQPASGAGSAWTGAWSTSPARMDLLESDSRVMNVVSAFLKLINVNTETKLTFRSALDSTLAGEKVKFTLSNKYGTSPIVIEKVAIAKTDKSQSRNIQAATNTSVTFNGSTSVTIPVGGSVECDPINMSVAKNEGITISYLVKARVTQISTGGQTGAKVYLSMGDKVNTEKISSWESVGLYDSDGIHVVPLLTNLDVYTSGASAIVIVGDSMVNNEVPEILSKKMASYGSQKYSVLQQTIMGNRLIHDGAGSTAKFYGESLVSRFQSDVLSQKGVKHIFVKIGASDIAHPMVSSLSAPFTSTTEIINGYKKLINMAHSKGVKIYFMTIPPWNGHKKSPVKLGETSLVWNSDAQAMCEELNKWIRSKNGSDGYVELDGLKNPSDPSKIRSDYTSDGMNLNAKGQQALVDAIPLSIFGIKAPNPPTTTIPNRPGTTVTQGGGSMGGSGGGSGSDSYTYYPGSGQYEYNPTQAVIGDITPTGEYVDPPTSMNYNAAIPIDIESDGIDGLGIALRASKIISVVVSIVMVACIILLVMLNKKRELV